MRMCSVLCGDLNGKEIQKRGDMCIHTADSFHCTVETNTTLLNNYTSIKKKKKESGVFLVVQWFRLRAPKEGGLGLNSSSEN